PGPANGAISAPSSRGRRPRSTNGRCSTSSAIERITPKDRPWFATKLAPNCVTMPLHWNIAPLEQMGVCVSEGVVSKDELLAYFKALEEAGAVHYRKLLDASGAECHLTA